MIDPAKTIVESLTNGTISYEQALENLHLYRDGARDIVTALKTQIRETEDQADDMTARIVELKAVKSLNPEQSWRWEAFPVRPPYPNSTWAKHFSFHMVGYFFSIILKERTDRKRIPYDVDVTVEKTNLANGEVDRSYGRVRYGDEMLHKRFKHLADAEAFVTSLQEQLVTDHMDVITLQKIVYKAAQEANTRV